MQRTTGSAGGRGGGAFSELMARARRGEAAAVAELYERHAARVMTVVRMRLSPLLRAKYDTLDLAHSVFLDVLRRLPRIEDRGERAFARLLAIQAENKVRMKLRRHLGRGGARAERPLPSDDDEQAPAASDGDAAVGADERAKLRTLVSGLDATTREVLRLYGEGRSFEQIAATLSITPAAARKRRLRAIATMRDLWRRAEPVK
jgi:RNA polymerase sigma factor (sigma-70 family)